MVVVVPFHPVKVCVSVVTLVTGGLVTGGSVMVMVRRPV
jgi:hypothetical protein